MAKKNMYLFSVLYFVSACLFGNVVSILFLLCMFMCYAWVNRGLINYLSLFRKCNVSFVFFCLFSLLSTVWAQNREYSLEMGARLVEIALFFVVFYICYKDEQGSDPLLKVIMYGGYLVSTYIVYQIGISRVLQLVTTAQRVTYHDSEINANSIGMYAAFSIIINSYYLIYEKKVFHIRNLLLIPGALALIISQSRKCFIIVFLGILLLLIFHNYHAKDRNALLSSILKLLLLAIPIIIVVGALKDSTIFSLFFSRMKELTGSLTGQNTDATVRLLMISSGLRGFLNSPIFGNGIDNGRIFSLASTGFDVYLHNNFVELLAGVGIVGFILYYYSYYDALKTVIKHRMKRDRYFDILIVLLVCRLILELGQVTYYGKDNVLFIVFFSLQSLYVVRNNINEQ